MSRSILLVDDDRGFSSLAQAALAREGHPVVLARSLHEAREAVERAAPELVVLDRRLPDGDGLDYLPELKAQLPSTPVVMVTAHGDIQSAVDAIRAGAADYVAKPVDLTDLVMRAQRAMGEQNLRERLSRVEAELSGRRRLVPPRSPAMRQVLAMLERIATSPRSPVFLLGPTGAGKEVLARHVHAMGAGEDAPFVHVNCAALPESTVESELFGHEKGAFTDAKQARRGLVEVASGGTLFLDEVGELPLPLQAKLLTFLDSGRFRRVGSSSEESSSARVVAATNRNLELEIREGRFREDLWFRLSVFAIHVPPLRDRPEDVIPLAEQLLSELGQELGRKGFRLGEQGRARLQNYPFPGNVRELRNVLERALVLEAGPELTLSLLQTMREPIEGPAPAGSFVVTGDPRPLEEIEKRYVRHVLGQLGGRRVEAARVLGLSYPTFLKRLED
ncbi:MAG TPA: sigma-54 dependent transcriptional regulator [Myxococcaceae bacterium]|nr:sigma-54 dependent transcriptional regulator [Myxococcaceae bacterium]